MPAPTLALLLSLGLLALAACGQTGTPLQPTTSPDEVQDEEPQAQEPEGGPIH